MQAETSTRLPDTSTTLAAACLISEASDRRSISTGKERDTESGNDYFGARYYGSSMGRFMSPDDGIDQDFYDPQSWNLYSYVRNNPLNRVDADGRQVTVCSNVTNSDGSAGKPICNTISDDAYKAGVAAQQAANANNPPYAGFSAPGGDRPNGDITDNGQVVGTATWSPNPVPDNGAVIPGDMGLGLVAGGMASDYVVGRVVGALFGRAAGAATEGTVGVAASGASKALLTDGTKQAARDIVDGLADGAQKASAKRFINAVQPGREVSITLKSDGTIMMSGNTGTRYLFSLISQTRNPISRWRAASIAVNWYHVPYSSWSDDDDGIYLRSGRCTCG